MSLEYFQKKKISYFKMLRLMGYKFAREFVEQYIYRKIKNDDYKAFIYSCFTYQLFMKNIETDIVLLINFDSSLRSYLPIGSKQMLTSPDFNVPMSIMFGEYDWMRKIDSGASEEIIVFNKIKFGQQSNHLICPSSNHDMNIDNPAAVSACIINDLLFWRDEDKDKRLPVLPKEGVIPEFTL